MKGVIFFLVNTIVLLSFMLVLYAREVGYLESKVDFFDKLAEDYRVMLHPKMPCPKFPWHTLYDKDGKRPPTIFLEERKMKEGDKVDYSGELSGGKPRKNCVIEGIDESGLVFNQPMATLVDVDHWVSLKELTLCAHEG